MTDQLSANALEQLLFERLQSVEEHGLRGSWNSLLQAWKSHGGSATAANAAPTPGEASARLQSLPVDLQDALRRYYIFQQSEEWISWTMRISPAQFRRLRSQARAYVLGAGDVR